jgi:predicted dienelactone hydrolase
LRFSLPLCSLLRFAAAEPPYPVGFKQIEFTDGERQIALAVFYPATPSDSSAKPTGLPFFTNLHLYRDAGLREGRHPLVMLSHGRGSNPLQYAWFAETLAGQGYIVAGLYHYRANTYDQTIAYLSNKIWQRPRDISLAIDFLLKDLVWARRSTRRGSASPVIRKAASPRCGSAAPRSMPTNSSPSRRAGRQSAGSGLSA